MLKIYLARHGQDEDNEKGILNGRRDKPLTRLGTEQAEELAQKILKEKILFERIYSSPLKRAYKTAEIIADTLSQKKPVVMTSLIERDFGVMTGKKQSDIAKYCRPNTLKTATVEYFLNPKDAETFGDLIKRGKKVIGFVSSKFKNGNVLLVTHGDIGKMIYASYYGLNWEDVLKMFHFGNSDLLLLSSDSVPKDSHVFKIKQHNL